MKLRSKFLIITFLSVIQVAVLSTLSLTGLKSIQIEKDYQLVQSQTQKQFSEIINYLNAMEYWGFNTEDAYTNWQEILQGLDKITDLYFDDKVINRFPAEYKIIQITAQQYFTAFSRGLDSVGEKLRQMESVPLTSETSIEIRTIGIREALKNFENDPSVIRLMELAQEAGNDVQTIQSYYTLLSDVTDKSSVLINSQVEHQEKFISILILVIAIFSCLSITLIILSVTTNVSKKIVSVKDMTKTLADKDFTVGIVPHGSKEIKSLMTNINNMVDQINQFFTVVKVTASRAISSGYTINDAANSTAAATAAIDENIQKIMTQFDQMIETVGKAIMVISDMNVLVDTLVNNNESQSVEPPCVI